MWSATSWISGSLVVVGEDDGVALRRERADLLAESSDLLGRESVRCDGLDRRELLHEPFLS